MIVQYQNSPRLMQIVENIKQYFDTTQPLDQFYAMVWNIDTAQGFGLDVWGRIVGVGRYLEVIPSENLGFYNGIVGDTLPFNEGTMYAGEGATDTYRLADDAYRVLILAKALSNIVATTSEAINQVLQNLFPNRGRCYVNDMGGMEMRYTFEFFLEPWEFSVVSTAGILPHSSGVRVILGVIPSDTFGFQEAAGSQPFGQGSLLSTGALINVT